MPRKPVAAWPAPYEDIDAYSVQALAQGKATEHQQKIALDWIINHACGTYDRSAVTDSANETFFKEGSRDAGRQIIYLMKLNMSAIAEARTKVETVRSRTTAGRRQPKEK